MVLGTAEGGSSIKYQMKEYLFYGICNHPEKGGKSQKQSTSACSIF